MDEMEQEVPQNQPDRASQPEQRGGNKQQELLERFVYNAMNLASDTSYNEMLSMAKSADNGPQAIARALLFIVTAVRKGLKNKGVSIPGQLYLAENGILSQVSRVVAALLYKAGIEFEAQDVAMAIEMVATQLASDYDREQSGSAEGQPEGGQPQPGQAPQQAPQQGPQQGPQQPQPGQAPQQGLMPQAMQGGM